MKGGERPGTGLQRHGDVRRVSGKPPTPPQWSLPGPSRQSHAPPAPPDAKTSRSEAGWQWSTPPPWATPRASRCLLFGLDSSSERWTTCTYLWSHGDLRDRLAAAPAPAPLREGKGRTRLSPLGTPVGTGLMGLALFQHPPCGETEVDHRSGADVTAFAPRSFPPQPQGATSSAPRWHAPRHRNTLPAKRRPSGPDNPR